MARVLLFGRLADLAGWRERRIEADSLVSLRSAISAADPDLGEALQGPSVQVALDKVLVRGDRTLGPDAEVAFLPPMSGG
ncbi:MAG: MoaD/ThiS family protein [Caulobacteraceae bacterium]|jgi:molybdopterin synthase sulfur carrier subunit|nr:MoaD/ThiS family protein [Caulobacteraceae bacterium]